MEGIFNHSKKKYFRTNKKTISIGLNNKKLQLKNLIKVLIKSNPINKPLSIALGKLINSKKLTILSIFLHWTINHEKSNYEYRYKQ
jgi:hypothetical protein